MPNARGCLAELPSWTKDRVAMSDGFENNLSGACEVAYWVNRTCLRASYEGMPRPSWTKAALRRGMPENLLGLVKLPTGWVEPAGGLHTRGCLGLLDEGRRGSIRGDASRKKMTSSTESSTAEETGERCLAGGKQNIERGATLHQYGN